MTGSGREVGGLCNKGFRGFRLCLQQKFELGSIEVHGRRVLLSPEKEYRPPIHPPLSKRGPKRGGIEEPIGERVCRGMLIGWSVGRIAAKPKGLRKKKQVRGICGGCRHDIGLHCTRVLAFGSPLKRAEARVPAVACGIRGEI